jgi:endonuclease/exonuclease/phosphatase (EEP) superfamily protein YafD
VLDLTSHFRLQYLLSAVMLLVLTLPRRLWRASAALAAAGAISLTPVLPYVPNQSTNANAASPGATALTLASVNVSYRQFSARRLLDGLAAAAPDVVLVVEFTPHAAEVLAALDERYTYSYKLPAEGPYGIAVWSRYELEAPTTFLLGRVPAIEARVRTPGGAFTFLGVHLSAPTTPRRAAQRNDELALLAARRLGVAGPVVVAGDFNVTPYSPFYGDWLTASGLTDTRRGRTLSASWPTMLPFAAIPIDHVAVNGDFDILRHRRLPNFDSDHYGVLADLALHASASPQ